MMDELLQKLLIAYRLALEIANSGNSWVRVRDKAARDIVKEEEGQAAEVFSLDWWNPAFLRYLLHLHIKTRITAIRRAYARRAATQEKPGQFSVELDALQYMDQAVPTRPSPWKLWAALAATVVFTTGVGARRSAEMLKEQDWAVLDRFRESIVSLGAMSPSKLLLLIEEGSAVLLLMLILSITSFVALVLFLLRDPFLVKRVLLSGKFALHHEGKLHGLKEIPGSPFKIPANLDRRGAYVLERTLFENLGERCPTEVDLDLCSSVFAVVAYFIFLMLLLVTTSPAELTGQEELVLQIMTYLIQWALFVAPAIHYGVRTWHRWRARMTEASLVLDGFWKTLIRSPLVLVPMAGAFMLSVVHSILERL